MNGKTISSYRRYTKIGFGNKNHPRYSGITYLDGAFSSGDLEIKNIPKEIFPMIIGVCNDKRTGEQNFIAYTLEKKNLINKILRRAGPNTFIVPGSKVKSKFLVLIQKK